MEYITDEWEKPPEQRTMTRQERRMFNRLLNFGELRRVVNHQTIQERKSFLDEFAKYYMYGGDRE